MRGVIRYFFEHDYSLAHSTFAGAFTFAVYRQHYFIAAAIFITAVGVCAVVEHRLGIS